MSKEEWDNDPRLAELDVAFDKILNAVERNEGLTRKEWMTSYEYGSSSSCGLRRELWKKRTLLAKILTHFN